MRLTRLLHPAIATGRGQWRSRDSYENYQDFATANLAVMTDGSVSVASTDTGDWTRDSSGNWIKD